MSVWSVRTTHHDGTTHYTQAQSEQDARFAYTHRIRHATSAVKLVELRRHDDDGEITLLASKEGRWRA